MDTSEEYVLMCRKAVEIQEKWKSKKGDWFLPRLNMNVRICIRDDALVDNLNSIWSKKDSIFLPRQGQLQGMVDWENEDYCGFVKPNFLARETRFWNWMHIEKKRFIPKGVCAQATSVTSGDDGFNRFYTSMEQLWLAFVMHEKYDKKWEDKSWH